jgi:hypothetical protein
VHRHLFLKWVASKGLAGAFFTSVAGKEVICTMLEQFRGVFVSVANARPKVPAFSMEE